jgi:hypothetical protein
MINHTERHANALFTCPSCPKCCSRAPPEWPPGASAPTSSRSAQSTSPFPALLTSSPVPSSSGSLPTPLPLPFFLTSRRLRCSFLIWSWPCCSRTLAVHCSEWSFSTGSFRRVICTSRRPLVVCSSSSFDSNSFTFSSVLQF